MVGNPLGKEILYHGSMPHGLVCVAFVWMHNASEGLGTVDAHQHRNIMALFCGVSCFGPRHGAVLKPSLPGRRSCVGTGVQSTYIHLQVPWAGRTWPRKKQAVFSEMAVILRQMPARRKASALCHQFRDCSAPGLAHQLLVLDLRNPQSASAMYEGSRYLPGRRVRRWCRVEYTSRPPCPYAPRQTLGPSSKFPTPTSTDPTTGQYIELLCFCVSTGINWPRENARNNIRNSSRGSAHPVAASGAVPDEPRGLHAPCEPATPRARPFQLPDSV